MALTRYLFSSITNLTKLHVWHRQYGIAYYKCKYPIGRLFCTTPTEPPKNNKKKIKPFRHNYPEELEGEVNNQILAEFNASMVYLSIYCYYGRTDIALPGCQSFFKMMYTEEYTHAMEFISYQLMRGGQVKLYPITTPENSDWTDITIALGVALELEKRVKDKLECLFKIAEQYNDLQLMDMLSTKYIKTQNESIWEMGRLLTRAKRLVDTGGVGRHLYDQALMEYVVKKSPNDAIQYM